MLPRFRLQTKITVAAVAAIVIPEKGLFNMTVERFLIERLQQTGHVSSLLETIASQIPL